MKSLWVSDGAAYDGTQLRSLYGYLEHKLMGDSVIAWRGGCSVPFEHMVDGEDFLAGATIAGSDMLHFIIEKFHLGMHGAVLLQRLFAAMAQDLLRESAPALGGQLRRSGDDIYLGDGKMSISIATVSPVSALVHFAMNVSNRGTPVKTAAFEDFGLACGVEKFAAELMRRFVEEINSADAATTKVRWVK